VLWRGWRVVSATEAEVHLLPVARSRPVYLGLKDGYVAIFLGPPQLGLIEEVTGIRAGGLLPADADRLKAGIGVPDLVHAWQLIQGLAP
jgi:hypothetical protein